jgi:hypothetical protein|tara:strand:- start:964 stop:1242 length:279 start_codon:yes stop_codon:yes gene_type:complete
MDKFEEHKDWSFEVVMIRGRKSKIGEPYSALCNITIVNGEPSVEGLLSTEEGGITIRDIKTIKEFIGNMGFSKVNYCRRKPTGKEIGAYNIT